MKIAILTQPLYTNYGGILQAYAVQKILKDMGHEVITLDLRKSDATYSMSIYLHLNAFIKTFIYFLIGKIKAKEVFFPFNNKSRNQFLIRYSMQSFIDRIINRTPILKTETEIKKYIEEQKFDAYIVGSDQVWRPIYSPNIEWFFLSFLSDNSNAKRIALSASFGISEWEFTKQQTIIVSKLAKKFDAISVREISGINLCHEYLKVNALQIIDPTMMLDPKDYTDLFELDKENTENSSGIIFTYILDISDDKKKLIDFISRKLKKATKSLNINIEIPPYASKKATMRMAPKPVAQWIRNFMESDFVVTDSFHGTVFSILYHRPFLVVANKSRGLARIETLLGTFGLLDRLVESINNKTEEYIIKEIDWNKVDKILKGKRTDFQNFLINNL